jgi:hypothetical protein
VACEVIQRLSNRFESEYLEKIDDFHLDSSLLGSAVSLLTGNATIGPSQGILARTVSVIDVIQVLAS